MPQLNYKGWFFKSGAEESIVNESLVLKILILQIGDQKHKQRKKWG
jgi:hypothetical protein